MTREKCGLAVLPALPVLRDVLPTHCARPSLNRQLNQAIRRRQVHRNPKNDCL